MPKKKLKLEITSGDTRLLLIAPHGKPTTEFGTAEITRAVRQALGSCAIINDTIAKSVKNLNRINQIADFPLYTNAIRSAVQGDDHTLVVFIHGASDAAIQAEAEDLKFSGGGLVASIGYGQPSNFCAHKKTAEALIKALTDNGLPAAVASHSEKRNRFCAAHPNVMTQWFKANDFDDKKKVEAIQIEFKASVREKNQRSATAEKLTAALSAITGLGLPASTESKESNKNDDEIAQKAYFKLRDIFSEHFGIALMEAGKYIFETFYESNIQAVRDKSPVKESSLRRLVEMLGQRDDGAPSRSWLNNAVRLHVSILELEQNAPVGTVQTFGQLSTSHKVQIVRLPEIKAKIRFIKKSVDKKGETKWSVRKLKEEIDKHLNVQPSVPGLPQLIGRPEKLFSGGCASLLESDYLSALKPKTIQAIRQKAKEYVSEYQRLITQLDGEAKRREIEVPPSSSGGGARSPKTHAAPQDQSTSAKIAKTKNLSSGKTNNPKSKKRSKYQDWVYKTVSCCNGCINDCVYCFARGDAVNKKRLKLADWPLSKIRQHDVDKKYKLFETPVMFPGTHDIYTENFDACMIVLSKLLKAGNRVLVVSKPRYEIIVEMEKQFSKFRNNLLFRFTIGAMNNDILSLWEPKAPTYEDRKKSMAYLFEKGYRTSVSIEPMLEPDKAVELVHDLTPHVNHSLWIGTMNHLWYFETDIDAASTEAAKIRVQNNLEYYGAQKAAKIRSEAIKIVAGQSAENLRDIYGQLESNPLVKWKWHIKHALGLPQPDRPEQWPVS